MDCNLLFSKIYFDNLTLLLEPWLGLVATELQCTYNKLNYFWVEALPVVVTCAPPITGAYFAPERLQRPFGNLQLFPPAKFASILVSNILKLLSNTSIRRRGGHKHCNSL